MTSWAWTSAFGWKCHPGVSVHNAIAVIGVRKALLIGKLCHHDIKLIFKKLISGILSNDKEITNDNDEIESSGINKHLLNVPIWKFCCNK